MSEAIALHEATLRLIESKLGPDHPDTLTSRNNLAVAYQSLGRWADAEALARHAGPPPQGRQARQPPPGRRPGRSWPEPARAIAVVGGRAAIARVPGDPRESDPDDWRRFDAMSLLGGSLLGQGRYAEAEPLIVQVYEGMKARESRIPVPARSLLREAAERVVRLYQDWNKPDQAAAWKAKVGMPDLPADVFVPAVSGPGIVGIDHIRCHGCVSR